MKKKLDRIVGKAEKEPPRFEQSGAPRTVRPVSEEQGIEHRIYKQTVRDVADKLGEYEEWLGRTVLSRLPSPFRTGFEDISLHDAVHKVWLRHFLAGAEDAAKDEAIRKWIHEMRNDLLHPALLPVDAQRKIERLLLQANPFARELILHYYKVVKEQTDVSPPPGSALRYFTTTAFTHPLAEQVWRSIIKRKGDRVQSFVELAPRFRDPKSVHVPRRLEDGTPLVEYLSAQLSSADWQSVLQDDVHKVAANAPTLDAVLERIGVTEYHYLPGSEAAHPHIRKTIDILSGMHRHVRFDEEKAKLWFQYHRVLKDIRELRSELRHLPKERQIPRNYAEMLVDISKRIVQLGASLDIRGDELNRFVAMIRSMTIPKEELERLADEHSISPTMRKRLGIG